MSVKPSITKQILGATIGSTLAVGLYYTYTLASPIVTSYILRTEDYPKFLQGETTVISNTLLKGDRKDRIENRVQKSITFEEPATQDIQDQPELDLHSGAPNTFFPVPSYTVPVETQITETITTTTTQVVPTQTVVPQTVVNHAEALPNSGMNNTAMMFMALLGAIVARYAKRLFKFVL